MTYILDIIGYIILSCILIFSKYTVRLLSSALQSTVGLPTLPFLKALMASVQFRENQESSIPFRRHPGISFVLLFVFLGYQVSLKGIEDLLSHSEGITDVLSHLEDIKLFSPI